MTPTVALLLPLALFGAFVGTRLLLRLHDSHSGQQSQQRRGAPAHHPDWLGRVGTVALAAALGGIAILMGAFLFTVSDDIARVVTS